MNPIKSIVWKELRQQVPLFVAVIIFGTLLLAVAFSLTYSESHSKYGRPDGLRIVALVGFAITCLYAVVSSGMTYASESESRTRDILRVIPFKAIQLFLGKIAVAGGLVAVCLLALMGGLWILTRWLGVDPAVANALFFGKNWIRGIWVMEFFMWGLVFSLIFSRPLVAIALGAVAAPCLAFCLSGFDLPYRIPYAGEVFRSLDAARINSTNWSSRPTQADVIVPFIYWLRLAGVCVLGIVGAGLAHRWLRPATNRPWKGDDLSRSSGGVEIVSTSVPRSGRDVWSGKLPVIRRFVWLAIRSNCGLMLVWAFLAFFLIKTTLANLNPLLFVLTIPVLGGLAGAFVFTPDKTSRGETFLGIRSARPGSYWIVNVLLWAFWIVLILVPLGLLSFDRDTFRSADFPVSVWQDGGLGSAAINGSSSFKETRTATGIFVSGVLACFAAGQFCSMLVSSRILAAGASLFVSVAVSGWYLLVLFGGVPIFVGVIPILAGLLGGGLLATRWWLAGEMSARKSAAVVAGLMVLALCNALFITRYRVVEIPESKVPFVELLGEYPAAPRMEILAEMERRLARVNETVPRLEFKLRLRDGVAPLWTDNELARLSRLDEHGYTWFGKVLCYSHFGELMDPVQKETMDSALGDGSYPGFGYSSAVRSIDMENAIREMDSILDANKEWLDEVRETIDFCLQNSAELKSHAAALRNAPDAINRRINNDFHHLFRRIRWFPDGLVRHDFYRALRQGDKNRSWRCFKTLVSVRFLSCMMQTSEGNDLRVFPNLDARNWPQLSLMPEFDWWVRVADPEATQLQEAIRFIESTLCVFDPNSQEVVRIYNDTVGFDSYRAWMRNRMDGSERLIDWALSSLTTEDERLRRLVDAWFATGLARVACIQSLESPEAPSFQATYLRPLTGLESVPDFISLAATTSIWQPRTGFLVDMEFQRWTRLEQRLLSDWAIRNLAEVEMLKLGVYAHLKEHGAMPENLESLVPAYISKVPQMTLRKPDGGVYYEAKWKLHFTRQPVLGNSQPDPSGTWLISQIQDHPWPWKDNVVEFEQSRGDIP